MAPVLYLYIHKLRETYAVIAHKIEELIVLLNEAPEVEEEHVRNLTRQVIRFLDRLNYSVMFELRNGSSLPSDFLASVKEELHLLRTLSQTVALAPEHPTTRVISKIHELYTLVEEEMKKQEAIARRMAKT